MLSKIALFFILCLLMFNSGCTYRQTVHEKYPVWGEEIYLPMPSRNNPLHMQLLEPDTPDKISACLLIVHGMNEYIGRYRGIAVHFAGRYVVAGVDLTAHGLTNPVLRAAHNSIIGGAEQYDVSDMYLQQAQLSNLQPMRDDLDRALRYLVDYCDEKAAGNKLPVFILSHSLGSLVTASYLLQTQNSILQHRIKGVIFCGPAFSVTRVPSWRGWLQNPLVRFSFHTHEHFLAPQNEPLPAMLFNQLLALASVPLQDGIVELLSLPGMRSVFSPTTPDWVVNYLSDWEPERKRHRADNYIIRRSILRYVLAVEKEIIRFRKNMDLFDTPYLLIYSEQDPITPAWGNTDFAVATQYKHSDNKLVPLVGANHHEQLFSSPALREYVIEQIDRWLQLRLSHPQM